MSGQFKASSGRMDLGQAVREAFSLTALFNEPFGDDNAIVFRRTLSGDFDALAAQLGDLWEMEKWGKYKAAGRRELALLRDFLSPEGAKAMDCVLEDMKAIEECQAGLYRCSFRAIPTQGYEDDSVVRLFHRDGRNQLLCCYDDLTTEYVDRDDVIGPIKSDSVEVAVRSDARVYRMEKGALWRQRGRFPDYIADFPHGRPVRETFIHRAPSDDSGDKPRLLLIASDCSPA